MYETTTARAPKIKTINKLKESGDIEKAKELMLYSLPHNQEQECS